MVEEPAGSCNDDVRTLPQTLILFAITRAPKEHHRPHVCKAAVVMDRRFNLGRELALPIGDQHRNAHVKQVLGPIARGPAARVERESEKRQTLNTGEGRRGLRL